MATSFTPGSLLRAAALATLAAFPACGGGSNPVGPPATTPTAPPPTTLAPAPAKLSDLSASVTSPQANGSIGCDGEVRGVVGLTNRAASSVVVTGVLMRYGTVFGDCRGDGEFTFPAANRTVASNTTAIVLDQRLFSRGAGCCIGRGCAGSCRFQAGFEVITEAGSVPAGAFNYTVFFQGCSPCLRGASAGGGCPPASLGTPD
jgi:hypothetical protein